MATRLSDAASDLAPQPAKNSSESLLEWTERVRRINDAPMLPSELPWLRDLYRLDARTTPEAWVMKASQVFMSEWLINVALHAAHTRHGGRGNALYVFPKQEQMDDFVQARVDKAIEESPALSSAIGGATGFGKRAVERVRLKRIGRGHIYFRGSDQRTQLISIDADVVIPDEVEEFAAGRVDLLRKRLASSLLPCLRGGSHPKYPSSGIAPIWQSTTRRHYFLRCAACGHRQHLAFPDNVTEDGRLVCARGTCRRRLDPSAEGEWVAEEPTARVEGFHVNRMYSPRADLQALATLGYAIKGGLISDPTRIQEFHNQDLGLPHAPAGGSLTDDILQACVLRTPRDFGHPSAVPALPVVMGVDVGAVLHVIIKSQAPEPADIDATRLLYAGMTQSWDELDALMARFRVSLCVVDALPDERKSAAFARRHRGRVYRCFYPNMGQWKHDDVALWNADEQIVQAHRTSSLDGTFDRFFQQLEELPREAEYLPGLFAQLKAPIRVLTKDADGKTVARYDEGTADDHYAHAYNYAQLAWSLASQPVPRKRPVKFGGR